MGFLMSNLKELYPLAVCEGHAIYMSNKYLASFNLCLPVLSCGNDLSNIQENLALYFLNYFCF